MIWDLEEMIYTALESMSQEQLEKVDKFITECINQLEDTDQQKGYGVNE